MSTWHYVIFLFVIYSNYPIFYFQVLLSRRDIILKDIFIYKANNFDRKSYMENFRIYKEFTFNVQTVKSNNGEKM